MANVIVLTIGLTGSSVLAGLLAHGGHSTGDRTMKKVDYDTFENLELTELNKRLIRDSGCNIDHTVSFSWRAIGIVERAADRIDTAPYRAFIDRTEAQRPWLWKDPRLWLTIRFWRRLMSFDDVKFVWLVRDDLQSWISANLRRQIISYPYCRRYNAEINASIQAFLEKEALSHMRLSFDELIVRPEATLGRLSAFLGMRLGLDDLRAVYDKPLYRNARGLRDLLLAGAIHGKNFAQRINGA